MMWKQKSISKTVIILVLSLLGSLAWAGDAVILPLNSPADLDLSGNIIYAINFGNNGNPQFGEVIFSQDQDLPAVTLDKSSEDLVTLQGGAYPSTGYPDLDMLLAGLAWKNSKGNVTTSVTINGLEIGMPYQLQLIFYTDHERPMDIIVEGDVIIEKYDPFLVQVSEGTGGGSTIKHNFIAGDSSLNVSVRSTTGDASLINGMILTQESPDPIPFADCGSGTTIELAVGKGIWQLNWGQGPWTWSDSTASPLLDTNVTGLLDLHATAQADVSADLVANLPIAGTLTLSAHDTRYKDVITGTMVLSGTGLNAIDINAARVIVDEGNGMAFAPFHPPIPKLSLTLDEATGVFAYIDEVQNCELSLAGSYAAPLVEGLGLQDNILAALGGKIPVIGGIGTFALNGQFIPDMSKKTKSFCEYGNGVALQLGAGGAVWDQTWGYGPYDWYNCDTDAETDILGKDVVGVLETTTAGAPQIDEDLILKFTFDGNFALTDYNDSNPDQVAGQILGDVKGTFVADMNAVNAVVDEAAGTITIAFGATLHDDPDALITVTETTGTFDDIHPVGVWEWYVSGTIVCARVPDLSVQNNIIAALGDETLLLSAEEEIVLSGSYYIDDQGE